MREGLGEGVAVRYSGAIDQLNIHRIPSDVSFEDGMKRLQGCTVGDARQKWILVSTAAHALDDRERFGGVCQPWTYAGSGTRIGMIR